MQELGKHLRKHREVVIHALSSSRSCEMGHLATAVLYRQTAARTLPVPSQGTRLEPQSSAPIHREEEPVLPPGTQCQKLLDLVLELDTVHN